MPPRTRARASLALPFLFALAACGSSDPVGSGPAGSGPVEVRAEVRDLVDSSRATRPNATFPGAPERTLQTRLWFASSAPRSAPACSRNGCALFVLAHGFGGSTERFETIGRWLAEAGYVVAAVRFPLTNDQAPGGHPSAIGDVVEQPADLSFVIDELLAASASSGDSLSGRIDPERIGILGHSLGGVTAIAHSRSACCTDRRVGAVVLVAGIEIAAEGFFGPISASGPPTLVTSGSDDPIVPPASSESLYGAIEAPRALVVQSEADHVDLIEVFGEVDPALERTRDLVIAFLDRYLGSGGDLEGALDDLATQGHLVRYDP
ncbi:MAG: alpha/beta fold hydrolase [Deltaproteobacteria bacterium]|nr:alpha/beta fold hydrolase [Deltaproteobacteria bacterium]